VRITNRHNLPLPIVNAIMGDDYTPGESDITVTQLICPPQMIELTRQNHDRIEEDCSMMLYALLGSVIHKLVEYAPDEPGAIHEDRLYMDVEGWKVGGMYDRSVFKDGLLQDYKVASVWEYIHGVKFERIAQLNMLATLAEENGYEVKELEAVFFFRDWIRSKALREKDYPPQIQRVPIPLWKRRERLKYLEDRVRVHQAARNGHIAPCTPDDMWQRPNIFAVMKEGRKSALRSKGLTTEALAQEWIDENEPQGDIYIELRPGERVRCATYCKAAPFCPQNKGA
jgi:hypothetical protein